MAVVFWLLVLGAGVVTGQPWAFLILAVLLMCLALTGPARPIAPPAPPQAPPSPERPKVAKAPQAAAPAPVVRDVGEDLRQLKRRWHREDHKAWDEEFVRLVAGTTRRVDNPVD